MDLLSFGVAWIIAIQSLGAWLEAPMKFFSFLGVQDFFFLVLPLIYWCIDASLGLRVGFILIASASLNGIVKLIFAGPRPYWVSAKVIPFAPELSFGIPSGHAQNAVSVWGIIAARIRKPWAWGAAIALAFLIGFSRWYLGVHFPHDVFVGWLLGALVLWAFIRFTDSVTAWVRSQTLGAQVSTIFIVSLLVIGLGMLSAAHLNGYTFPEEWKTNALRVSNELPDPVSMEGFVSSAGTFFVLAFGAVWLAARGGYRADGPMGKRALRFVVGLIGILIFWRGLALFLPDNADLISYIFRYLRYSLVGFWVSAGAPWLFFRFKLAQSQM